MKFSIKDFFSKCDQIRRKLQIWLHLLRKSLMENFIFCAVQPTPACCGFFWLIPLFTSEDATECFDLQIYNKSTSWRFYYKESFYY